MCLIWQIFTNDASSKGFVSHLEIRQMCKALQYGALCNITVLYSKNSR